VVGSCGYKWFYVKRVKGGNADGADLHSIEPNDRFRTLLENEGFLDDSRPVIDVM
jgi:hypothetical protein